MEKNKEATIYNKQNHSTIQKGGLTEFVPMKGLGFRLCSLRKFWGVRFQCLLHALSGKLVSWFFGE